MREVTLETLVEVTAAMAHPARLRMLALLREGELYVCQIRAVVGGAASTASAHLAILRHARLVTERKQGRFVQYGLVDEEPLASVVREILHLVKDEPQILDDARVLAAARRLPPDTLSRAGLDLTKAGGEGRSPIPVRKPGVARATRSI